VAERPVRIAASQVEARGESCRLNKWRDLLAEPEDLLDGGPQKHDPEKDQERRRRNHRREQGAGDGAARRREFQEHPHAHVGHAVAHVGGGRSGTRRDHTHDARSDRQADIDPEHDREGWHDDDPAADAREGADEPGADADGEDPQICPDGQRPMRGVAPSTATG